ASRIGHSRTERSEPPPTLARREDRPPCLGAVGLEREDVELLSGHVEHLNRPGFVSRKEERSRPHGAAELSGVVDGNAERDERQTTVARDAHNPSFLALEQIHARRKAPVDWLARHHDARRSDFGFAAAAFWRRQRSRAASVALIHRNSPARDAAISA